MKRKILIALLPLLIFALAACGVFGGSGSDGQSLLEVHFIDVGQADCALIMCEGQNMLIDGGNAADSALVYTYLRNNGVDYLDYVIATHPHEDHIGGIPGALSYASAGVCFSPVADDDGVLFEKLKAKLGSTPITVPSVGDNFTLGGASVTFLGPVELTDDANENSLVCRLEYNDISFLFTGDAGTESEKLMLDSGCELESTVLKVGHHGSGGSSCYEFLRAVNPQYAVISVEEDSRYGHPHESTLSRLIDSGATIYRTDKNGTVIFRTDGNSLTVSAEKGSGKASQAAEQGNEEAEAMYIGNISSQKYHRLTCTGLPAEKNRIYFYSLEEAINSGFLPCGICKP